MRRNRGGRTLARAISAGVAPSTAAAMALSATGSREAALDAWVDAALSRSRLDAESRLTKLAVSCAVLSALGAHRVLPYVEGGALLGSIYGGAFPDPLGCGHGGRIVMARTARTDAEKPAADDAVRMVALVVPAARPLEPSAGRPSSPVVPMADSPPRLERIYDTEPLGTDSAPPTISFFSNFSSFLPPSAPSAHPILPRLPSVPSWASPRLPERIAIAIAELPAAATVSDPERHDGHFHVPTLSSIERRFVPEIRMPEWAWGPPEASEFSADDDVMRLSLEAANAWAVHAFAREHRRAR